MLEELLEISRLFSMVFFVMVTLDRKTSMKQLTTDFPGARRALFAKYHIGGCSSCAYSDEESIQEVANRNEFDVAEAILHILESHEHDAAMILSPLQAQEKILAGAKLVDTRTREEHEAVVIPNSLFFSQELQKEAFGSWSSDQVVVLYDHLGSKALDTCAWFRGHNLPNTFIIKGGIDAWSLEIDRSIARYRLEME
jgi:rhodanese-related sulfurtransferase